MENFVYQVLSSPETPSCFQGVSSAASVPVRSSDEFGASSEVLYLRSPLPLLVAIGTTPGSQQGSWVLHGGIVRFNHTDSHSGTPAKLQMHCGYRGDNLVQVPLSEHDTHSDTLTRA